MNFAISGKANAWETCLGSKSCDEAMKGIREGIMEWSVRVERHVVLKPETHDLTVPWLS